MEVGLLCEQFHCTPDRFGFDQQNPRVMRDIRIAIQVYHAAIERHSAKKKTEWDKNNPAGARLLRWARQNAEPNLDAGEVKVALPERPKRG